MSRLFEAYCDECETTTLHDQHRTGAFCEKCECERFDTSDNALVR